MSERIPPHLFRQVRERANRRCEYCLVHEDDAALPHQADHVIARKHGGRAILDNLAYSCALCNCRKGSDIASVDGLTGDLVRLFNPRADDWYSHFRLRAGHIIPVTPEGRVTERLLQFNRPDLVQLRLMLARHGRYPRS